jgi:hypothetical protein
MNLVLPKSDEGRIAESERTIETLKVYAGSLSAPSPRGRTMRLVQKDSRFVPCDLRTAMEAGLETGKYYEIKAIVDTKTRTDLTKSIEVREILTAKVIPAFKKFEAQKITYVRPSLTPATAGLD